MGAKTSTVLLMRGGRYEQIIKDGDRLLNRIQKLSRVIAM